QLAGVHDDPIGGKFEFLAGTEYSFPIVGDELRGVVFIDVGTVTENLAVTPIRASVGTGVEWRVKQLGPMPMQFYLAVPVAKDKNDDTEIFSFSIGWMW
ncbi:MAG: BamA/TamA family outer membrane protein, partial [Planctomycetota bacterium]|nr:BamA/TamA family outer membrane protein [Planctomycetota bacterium]